MLLHQRNVRLRHCRSNKGNRKRRFSKFWGTRDKRISGADAVVPTKRGVLVQFRAYTQYPDATVVKRRPRRNYSRTKLQALVYDILPSLEEGAGKRCSECAHGPDTYPCVFPDVARLFVHPLHCTSRHQDVNADALHAS